MEETLNLDNILDTEDVENLFASDYPEETGSNDSEQVESEEPKNNNDNENTAENTDEMFGDSESVGSEENIQEEENTNSDNVGNSSHFFSSIAKALAEEGVFPNLEEEELQNANSAEDFRDLIEKQIRAGLEERQQRIDAALSAGVEVPVVKQYENTLGFLKNISYDSLQEESDEAENLRKRLIYQDYINRGFTQQRAQKEVQKALDNGTDVEDAKEALQSNIDYYNDAYNKEIEQAKTVEEAFRQQREKQAKDLKDSILSKKKVFGDIELDNSTRKKVFENLTKPVYKDEETGQVLTEIQKYERDNRTEFLKNLGVIFTLTNGFKDMGAILKNQVRRETKKGLKELENVINTTARTNSGSLDFLGGYKKDSNSFISPNWNLDI